MVLKKQLPSHSSQMFDAAACYSIENVLTLAKIVQKLILQLTRVQTTFGYFSSPVHLIRSRYIRL